MDDSAGDRNSADILAGLIILLGWVAGVVLFLNHPAIRVGGAHTPADIANAFIAVAVPMQIVHGGIAFVFCLETVAFARLSQRLGLGRLPVIGGLFFFAAGAIFLALGATLEGIVAPGLAAKCATAAQTCNALLPSLLKLLFAVLDGVTKLWVAGFGLAALAWSLALLRTRGPAPVIGFLGLGAGAAGIAAAVVPGLPEQAFLVALVLIGLWSIACAGLLLTRRQWP